jgi:hypothetical protein
MNPSPSFTLPTNLDVRDALAFRGGQSLIGLASDAGPNLMQVSCLLTFAELHEFLGYQVEEEISKKATGKVADVLHIVQRPWQVQRQKNISVYQERYQLDPKPLHESAEQGYIPAITLLANYPLVATMLPNSPYFAGMALVMVQRSLEQDTIVVPADGVARITGYEKLYRDYQKTKSNPESRRLLNLLNQLRIPALIMYPKTGELTELHMQQCLHDMNVLATPLTPTQGLSKDNRSPYNTVAKNILNDKEFDLKQYVLQSDANIKQLIRFVKIAMEGYKVAEKAGATGDPDVAPAAVTAASTNLAHFWSLFAPKVTAETLKMKDNLALSAPGIRALGLVAYELYSESGRGKDWTQTEKDEAIKRVGSLNWARLIRDDQGEIKINPRWEGILDARLDQSGKVTAAVLGGAGANNGRIMTAILLEVAGLAKSSEATETNSHADGQAVAA